MAEVNAMRPERKFTPHLYYSMTKSLCGVCKRRSTPRSLFRDDAVWFDKFCPEHGIKQCARGLVGRVVSRRALVRRAEHAAEAHQHAGVGRGLPVRLRRLPVAPAEGLPAGRADHLGLQPRLPDLLHRSTRTTARTSCRPRTCRRSSTTSPRTTTSSTSSTSPAASRRCTRSCPSSSQMCRDAGIRRLTISTNGLKLRDEAYVRKLAALDARIVLSLDTFRPETDKHPARRQHGEGQARGAGAAREARRGHDDPAGGRGRGSTTTRSGALLELVLAKPHIRSLELHTLTFTGQGGVGFQRDGAHHDPRPAPPDRGGHRRRGSLAGLRAVAAGAPALLLDLLPAVPRRRRLRAVRAPARRARRSSSCSRTRSTSSRARSWRRSSAI